MAEPSVLLAYRDAFLESLDARHRSPATARSYAEAINFLAAFLAERGWPTDPEEIERRHLEAFIADQLARHKPATAAVRFRSLRAFFSWCVRTGELVRSPMAGMEAPKVPVAPPPIVRDEDLRRLLEACRGRTFEDLRDHVILRLLIDCGLRRAEVAGIRLEDVDLRDGSVTVTGKGRKTRVAPFETKARLAILHYLKARAKRPDAHRPELFLGRFGPVTADGVAFIVERRAQAAGLGHLTAHRLRHTFGHVAQASGMDAAETARLMGHSSPWLVQTLYGASAADERARASYRRLRLGDCVCCPTSRPRGSSTAPYNVLAIECVACGKFIGLHYYTADGSYSRTNLYAFVNRPARVNGLPAYGPTDRQETRRPVWRQWRPDTDAHARLRALAREGWGFDHARSHGPPNRVYPPVHVFCLGCETPQIVERPPRHLPSEGFATTL